MRKTRKFWALVALFSLWCQVASADFLINHNRIIIGSPRTAQATLLWVPGSTTLQLTGSFSVSGTLTAGAFTGTTLTVESATPTVEWKDTDGVDADVNANIVGNLTDTGSGAEDMDLVFNQQIAGVNTAWLTADADGAITFGTGRDVNVAGVLDANSLTTDAGAGLDNQAAGTLLLGAATATKVEVADTGVETEVQGPLDVQEAANFGANGAGVNVSFFTDTAGEEALWSAADNQLALDGTDGTTVLDITDGNVVIADNLSVTGTNQFAAGSIDATEIANGTWTVDIPIMALGVETVGTLSTPIEASTNPPPSNGSSVLGITWAAGSTATAYGSFTVPQNWVSGCTIVLLLRQGAATAANIEDFDVEVAVQVPGGALVTAFTATAATALADTTNVQAVSFDRSAATGLAPGTAVSFTIQQTDGAGDDAVTLLGAYATGVSTQ